VSNGRSTTLNSRAVFVDVHRNPLLLTLTSTEFVLIDAIDNG